MNENNLIWQTYDEQILRVDLQLKMLVDQEVTMYAGEILSFTMIGGIPTLFYAAIKRPLKDLRVFKLVHNNELRPTPKQYQYIGTSVYGYTAYHLFEKTVMDKL